MVAQIDAKPGNALVGKCRFEIGSRSRKDRGIGCDFGRHAAIEQTHDKKEHTADDERIAISPNAHRAIAFAVTASQTCD